MLSNTAPAGKADLRNRPATISVHVSESVLVPNNDDDERKLSIRLEE